MPFHLARWALYSSAAVALLGILLATLQTIRPSSTTHCYAQVRTLSPSQPSASCFSVSSSGTFSRVFTPHRFSSLTKTVDPGYVIPGLWDGHGHLLQYGELLHSVNLFGAKSMSEVLERLKQYATRHPAAGTENEWIRGVGWDQAVFGGKMPTAAALDAEPLIKGKHVMLDRVDVHCIWVSQAVLQLLPDPFPDVPGGEVVRDPGMGVFCDNAMDLVTARWPKPSIQQKKQYLKSAMNGLNQVGLVGVHDAGVTPEELELYSKMRGTEDWTVRVYAMLECTKRNTFCPQVTAGLPSNDDWLSIKSVKLFADGALGSWGSALIEPYTDHPWTSGSLLVNSSDLKVLAEQWASIGFQVNIHAIGDLANRYAVEALSSALSLSCPQNTNLHNCQSQRRFRIEHAQIIHPDDQKRMHEIGLIPSIQPTHATSDMYYAEQRLGPDRTKFSAYRMRSLLPLKPILGSDFPVEPPDPFQGMYAALTRRNPHNGLDVDGGKEGWYTEETLSLEDALRGFMGGPAAGAFLDGKVGIIAPGAFADWVVLDAPLEGMDVEKLRNMSVRETWVGGRRVYRREDKG